MNEQFDEYELELWREAAASSRPSDLRRLGKHIAQFGGGLRTESRVAQGDFEPAALFWLASLLGDFEATDLLAEEWGSGSLDSELEIIETNGGPLAPLWILEMLADAVRLVSRLLLRVDSEELPSQGEAALDGDRVFRLYTTSYVHAWGAQHAAEQAFRHWVNSQNVVRFAARLPDGTFTVVSNSEGGRSATLLRKRVEEERGANFALVHTGEEDAPWEHEMSSRLSTFVAEALVRGVPRSEHEAMVRWDQTVKAPDVATAVELALFNLRTAKNECQAEVIFRRWGQTTTIPFSKFTYER